jgi:TPR repeat protein
VGNVWKTVSMLRTVTFLIAIWVVAGLCPHTARADMNAGYDAYSAGDFAKARRLFEKEAEAGDPAAQFNLAVMHERGEGTEKDMTRALHYYRQSATQEFAKAQYNLGLIYAEGRGVGIDLQQALAWFSRAADQGMEDAVYNRDMLREHLQKTTGLSFAPSSLAIPASSRHAEDNSAVSAAAKNSVGQSKHGFAKKDIAGVEESSPVSTRIAKPVASSATAQIPAASPPSPPARPQTEGFDESQAPPLHPQAAAFVPVQVQKRYDDAIADSKRGDRK